MSSIWLPLALAETTIILHEILDLKKWHYMVNWAIVATFALTTILNSILMIYVTAVWKYAPMSAFWDMFVTILRLIMTACIVMPLLGHLRLLRLPKVGFLYLYSSISTLDMI